MNLLSTFALLVFFIFIRYILFSFLIEKVFHSLNIPKVFTFKRKLNQKTKEITLSFYSSVIFGLAFTVLYHLWESRIITLETNHFLFIPQVFYLLISLFVHETYYYWMHRVIHLKPFYKLFHKGHHDSIEVSSWTSFSFDPLETILQVIPFFAILYFLPLHLYTLITFLVIMSVSSVINHLNREVYPEFFRAKFPFSQFIGATHHALHHKEFNSNYGLYFRFWDIWMNTESKNYSPTDKKDLQSK